MLEALSYDSVDSATGCAHACQPVNAAASSFGCRRGGDAQRGIALQLGVRAQWRVARERLDKCARRGHLVLLVGVGPREEEHVARPRRRDVAEARFFAEEFLVARRPRGGEVRKRLRQPALVL